MEFGGFWSGIGSGMEVPLRGLRANESRKAYVERWKAFAAASGAAPAKSGLGDKAPSAVALAQSARKSGEESE